MTYVYLVLAVYGVIAVTHYLGEIRDRLHRIAVGQAVVAQANISFLDNPENPEKLRDEAAAIYEWLGMHGMKEAVEQRKGAQL